ncbi:MAG TPA: carboxypeptidase regulatory-like domain-containing protein [Pirellulales bacterium]|nr:carboxypeptidase regulatory-like domain-containing protein [Pirellulales bacterium]
MRSCFLYLGVALIALQAACQKKVERLPVFPVRGKVLVEGQPAAGARVGFYPLDDPFAPKPQAQVGADGSFRLSTYETGDGAPAGRYGVTIAWPGPNPRSNGEGDEEIEGPDRLRGRYSDPQTSKWKIEVGSQPLELEPFNVE